MERGTLGLVLVAVAVLGVALLFGASAATAPEREVAGESGSRTLVGVQGGGPGLHEDGQVVVLDERGRAVRSVENADSYFDVTALDDGRVMAGFMDSGYRECGRYDPPCTRTGFRILDPNASDPTVFEYSFSVRTRKNSEVHDVERLPSGEYVLTDMEYERILTIRSDGTRTWQWSANATYDEPADPTRTDWLHINDVDYLGEDRFLVSVRNANQLVIVERGEGVVEVVNEDGDPDLLDRQHNPQWLAEDAILVADSENGRIVELHRTEGGEWVVAWELREANGIEFSWPRDADRLPNGNTLITDSANARVVEVNRSGAVVWSASFDGVMPYEAERLPAGETVGGPAYDGSAESSPDGADGGTVPVLTRALSVLRTGMPLPFWLTEWHLLAVVLAVPTAVTGSVIWWRDRRSPDWPAP